MAVFSGVFVRLSEVGKKLAQAKRVHVMAAVAVLMLASGGIWAAQTASSQRAAEQERQAAAAQKQAMEQDLKDARAKRTQLETKADQQTAPKAESTPTASPAPKTNAPKYATSSDPRSTAWSATPPAPNPKSFDIRITRNGQVAAGTLISYNANKGEKGYYGGDLVFSVSSVTISKSGMQGSNRPEVRVSTPDGAVVGMPSMPWYERLPVFMAMDSTKYKSTGTWFDMIVESAAAPNGTYQLPFYTSRIGQTTDSWYYYGFLTVHVID